MLTKALYLRRIIMSNKLTDGVYDVVAKGYEGNDTKLKVTVANHKIEQIVPKKEIVPNSLEDAVFTQIPRQIINNQTLDVDALTGASHSSKGLLDAVSEVIKQAGGIPDEFKSGKRLSKNISTATAEKDEKYSDWLRKPAHIDKRMDTDFLIIGAGISGLAAAVLDGE